MAAKLFVICGHGAGDPGACAGGESEADLVRQLAKRIKARGGSAVQVGDTSVNWYASAYISKGKCPKGVPVVELHMDSAAASAKGGHVIIKSGLTADKYDKALEKFIKGFFPGRSITLSKRSDLANPNRAYAKGVNYRLVECGFISNASDRKKFVSQMDELADGILAAFGIKGSGSASSTDKPAASKPAKEPAKKYSLKIDGDPGHYTWLALQEFLRTQKNADGEPCYGKGLKLDGDPGYYTYLAWQEFLRTQKNADGELCYGKGLKLDGVYGYYHKLAAQEWLRVEKNLDGEPCYGTGYKLDGVDGKGFYTALQECLRAKGFYN